MSRKLKKKNSQQKFFFFSLLQENLKVYNVGKKQKMKNFCFALVNSTHKKHKNSFFPNSPLHIFLSTPAATTTTTTILRRKRRWKKQEKKRVFYEWKWKILNTTHLTLTIFSLFFLLLYFFPTNTMFNFFSLLPLNNTLIHR